jgi:dTDP-4-amino-4,6-dideoxygalactose transaminase
MNNPGLGGKPVGVPARAPRWPLIDKASVRQVADLLESGHTVALGRTSDVIRKAEDSLSAYHGGRHVLTTNSGHAALMCALMGLEIGDGDEVITTPCTWGASTSCILAVGAVPVFADVDRVSGLLDPKKIEAAITPRTKAVLVVHLYGQPAHMPAINRGARKHGLKVIEDGSQAHGARIGGQVVGTFSDAAGFSSMGGKLLATSEAGFLVTPHEEVFWKAAMMCQHYGRSAESGFPDEFKPYVDSLVYTFRLSPLIAGLFPSQIRRLDAQVKVRGENAAALREALSACRFLQLPKYRKGVEPGFYVLTTNFLSHKAKVRRDTFLAALKAEGVQAFAYVPEGIQHWRRLQWKGYKGPAAHWQGQLRRARIDYGARPLPNCDYKVDHAVELSFIQWHKPARRAMQRMADAFLKVEDQIESLREYEAAQDESTGDATQRTLGEARRAAASYGRVKGR